MKQLTNREPLVNLLQNAHLVASLPFVDHQLDAQVPKSKVAYLIKAQQDIMNKHPQEYIRDLKPPILSYVDSEEFEREVARVQDRMQHKPQKVKDLVFPEVPKKLVAKDIGKVSSDVEKGVLAYEGGLIKNINLQVYKKYGPLVLKELIDILQKQKVNLSNAIQQETQAIQSLNQNRKYQQMETYQRESDIGERVKIMLNKRRKVD